MHHRLDPAPILSLGPSRARYPPCVLRPSASSHTASSPFDKITFKMDMEGMNASMNQMGKDMKKMKKDMNQTFFLGDQVEHDLPESFPGAMSPNDATTPALSQTNVKYFNETPSRRPGEDLYISPSSSTRKTRHSRTQKRYERPISYPGDTSRSMPSSFPGS